MLMSNKKSISDNKKSLSNISSTKQSLVLNTLPIAFYTTSAKGKFELTFMSKGVKNLTGFDVEKFGFDNKFWKSRIHPEDREMVVKAVSSVVENSSYEVEYRWKCAHGEYRWFYDRGEVIYDYQGKPREVGGSWINITDKKVTEQSINLLIKKTSSVTGRDFFCTLVKNISEILNVNYVFISKCLNTERTKVRTLAFWERNDYGDDIEYDLQGTPCKNVISGKFCYYDDNIIGLYPDDEELKKYDAQSYLGIPIYNSKNSVIGHLAVFHDDIFKDISNFFHILQVFALRAGSELERIEAEDSLRRSHDQLEGAFEEIKSLKQKLEKENVYLKEEIKTEYNFEEIIGTSKPLKEVQNNIKQVADTDATVLIRGETGTGKELISRAVHNLSSRNNGSLIKVNCPAIPSGLIESELFGHEKGSFTGAITKKIGKFELADGGTIFLDELGDLPLDAQAKLLRVIQEREFERVGGTETFTVDVRVIAATNRNLEDAVKEGKFRADLYYRLNVFPIELPSLRNRTEDITPLVYYFLDKYCRKMGKNINSISNDTLKRLTDYNWPGNIRELENIIERAVILSTSDTLEIDNRLLVSSQKLQADEGIGSTRIEDVEREHIIKVLSQTNWQVHGKNGAAKILDINPSTLRTRMAKLGIKKKAIQQDQ